jgi:hypothetical protein
MMEERPSLESELEEGSSLERRIEGRCLYRIVEERYV